MKPDNGYHRPKTFLEDEVYSRRVLDEWSQVQGYRTIKFIGYDPCPAFVIVQDGTVRKRCPREEIFAESNHY